jgi:hypothetical protein
MSPRLYFESAEEVIVINGLFALLLADGVGVRCNFINEL